MENFDVVIVGSGPAGSATAKCLTTNKQLKVVIAEKEDLPRYKMCSGIIAPTVQDFVKEHFGEIPEECFSKPKAIKGFKALRPDGSIRWESPPSLAYTQLTVWRSSFDNWLAQKSGAAIKSKCMFVSAQKENGTLIVKLKSNGEDIAVRTKYLVGADGGPSMVRRKVVNPDVNEDEFIIVAYEEHWTGTVALDPEFFYIFPDKMFCEFPMANFNAKDDRWVVVTSTWKGTKIKDLFKNFFNHLKEQYKFKPEKLVHSQGCLVYGGSCKNHFELGKGNVLLVGEAGGFLGGKTEGITPALYTGQIAAQAIIESIDMGIEAVSIYSRMIEPEKQRLRDQLELNKNFIMPV